jgi:hypothetical protein
VRAISLPNGNLLVPIEADDPDRGNDLAGLGPEYGRWLAFAADGEEPRPKEADA